MTEKPKNPEEKPKTTIDEDTTSDEIRTTYLETKSILKHLWGERNYDEFLEDYWEHLTRGN